MAPRRSAVLGGSAAAATAIGLLLAPAAMAKSTVELTVSSTRAHVGSDVRVEAIGNNDAFGADYSVCIQRGVRRDGRHRWSSLACSDQRTDGVVHYRLVRDSPGTVTLRARLVCTDRGRRTVQLTPTTSVHFGE